jgi:hypothetical protein
MIKAIMAGLEFGINRVNHVFLVRQARRHPIYTVQLIQPPATDEDILTGQTFLFLSRRCSRNKSNERNPTLQRFARPFRKENPQGINESCGNTSRGLSGIMRIQGAYRLQIQYWCVDGQLHVAIAQFSLLRGQEGGRLRFRN